MKCLTDIDELIAFTEKTQWPVSLKALYALRVQMFLDLEPYLKKAEIPPVDEVDA
jgi:hypothetical protein